VQHDVHSGAYRSESLQGFAERLKAPSQSAGVFDDPDELVEAEAVAAGAPVAGSSC
jgi:hypothetical protein